MKKHEIKALAEVLEAQLAQAENMWELGKEHAFIVGYLTGTIRQAIRELRERGGEA